MKNKRLMISAVSAACLLAAAFAGCADTKETEGTKVTITSEEPSQEESSETEAETSVTSESTAETSESTEAEVTTAETTEEIDGFALLGQKAVFEVTSEDLVDGVWADSAGNKENISPELTWEPVEGAGQYVIYMVDTSAEYWMHWKTQVVSETNLPKGATDEDYYVGPYPPQGATHTYEVYVLALKDPVKKIPGLFDSINPKFSNRIVELDAASEGQGGNILAYGHLTGNYTNK